MSSFLKRAWTTQDTDTGLYALTFESSDINCRLSTKELAFPKVPTRHTICLTYLSEEDLMRLYNVIGDTLYGP